MQSDWLIAEWIDQQFKLIVTENNNNNNNK